MTRAPAVGDPLITTFGRLVEVHSALGEHLGRALEQQCGIPHTWFEVLLRIARVQRVPCPTDRRVAFAGLTEDERAKLDEAVVIHAANLHRIFEDFSQQDLRNLDGLLDRLRARRHRLSGWDRAGGREILRAWFHRLVISCEPKTSQMPATSSP